jgi:hypothetical protein
MKTKKVSFDFSDEPKVLDLLRVRSAQKGLTQKAIVIEALNRYFGQEQEDEFLRVAASTTFAEWNNPEDEVYNKL